jgi:hypothetical protein
MPHTPELFPNGCGDEDEVLPLSSADDPLPRWLVEEWPGPAAMAKVERCAASRHKRRLSRVILGLLGRIHHAVWIKRCQVDILIG